MADATRPNVKIVGARPVGGGRRWLSRYGALVLAAAFLIAVALAALLAPWVSPHDPLIDLGVGASADMGTPGALFGTDNQGRDILSRIIWGGRISLVVALVPVFVSTLISLAIGIAAGVLGGWIDWLIMRFLDIFFAFPLVLLAIAIAGVLQPGLATVLISITIVLTPYISRVAHTATGMVTQQLYIEAARAAGAGRFVLVTRYIMPNMLAPVLVYATTIAGLMIVVGSGMSFLGLGVQPPTPDWGAMVGEGASVLRRAPHVTVLPGLAIVLTALAFNVLGDAVRDALDPKSGGRHG